MSWRQTVPSDRNTFAWVITWDMSRNINISTTLKIQLSYYLILITSIKKLFFLLSSAIFLSFYVETNWKYQDTSLILFSFHVCFSSPLLSSLSSCLLWPPSFLPASRAPAEGAGGDGPAAGQPADGREDELRQRRPDARPGAGRRPDRPVAPGGHTGPGGSRLCPPRELQPAQHWEPGYLLKHCVIDYILLQFSCLKGDRNNTHKC